MRAAIHTILRSARAVAKSAQLCALTSLAEGADRIFAEEAVALGYALICPLPFAQAEYEKDFHAPAALEADSLMHFRAILQSAREGSGLTVLELNGERHDAPQAYAAAGQAILDRADLLVGVWDGGEAAGPGGTTDMLGQALNRHIPVLCIDARAPERWALLRSKHQLAPSHLRQEAGLEAAVAGLVGAIVIG